MANKECEKILNLIPLYIDNLLSEKESDEVKKHLDECARCFNEYNYLKAIIGGIKDIPQKEVPPDFHKKLMEKVKTKSYNKKKRYITLKHISVGVAAAAAIAISFVALNEAGESNKTTKPSDMYITSRVSDEPIKKDAEENVRDDKSITPKAKSVNKAKSNVTKVPDDVVAEAQIQPAEQLPATVSLDEELELYKTVTVAITEENRDEVLQILSDYEKDETGYIVEDIEQAVEKLKESGASVTVSCDNTKTQSYIIVK